LLVSKRDRLVNGLDDFVGNLAHLRPLLQAYEHELAEHGFTDWPGVLRTATAAVTNPGYGHQLLSLPALLLDVPLTTASDVALVRALSTRSPEILVTVPAMDSVTLARLPSDLGADIVDLDSSDASLHGLKQKKNGSLSRLQRHIFNDAVAAPPVQRDEQVIVFSAPGESRECVEIVRRVLILAREGIAALRLGRQCSTDCIKSVRANKRHHRECFLSAEVGFESAVWSNLQSQSKIARSRFQPALSGARLTRRTMIACPCRRAASALSTCSVRKNTWARLE
jgi:hypothetical protein